MFEKQDLSQQEETYTKSELEKLLEKERNKVEDKYEPRDFNELIKLSEYLAQTDMVPISFKGKPGDIFSAVMMGKELGLKTFQSLNSIAPINGRPAIWGDMMLALCLKCDGFDIIETYDKTSKTATCTVKRSGRTDVTRAFSYEQAKKAGLIDKHKSIYGKYEEQMISRRARAFALRDMCPDITQGVYTLEEAESIKDESQPKIEFVYDRAEEKLEGLKKKITEFTGEEPESESEMNAEVAPPEKPIQKRRSKEEMARDRFEKNSSGNRCGYSG